MRSNGTRARRNFAREIVATTNRSFWMGRPLYCKRQTRPCADQATTSLLDVFGTWPGWFPLLDVVEDSVETRRIL